MSRRPAILRALRRAALAGALLAGGCAATGGAGGGEAHDEAAEAETATGGKGDSPFAAEREPCATSFDCELGLQCGDDGTCRPRGTDCGSDG